MKVRFKKLNESAFTPAYAHIGDSGMDIRSSEAHAIEPWGRHTFSTGIAAEIPDGYEIQIRPRSGMCAHGIVTMFGTVDSGYRGEIKVTVLNMSGVRADVLVGDKIGQMVLSPVITADVEIVDNIDTGTDRGSNGFGSTGR